MSSSRFIGSIFAAAVIAGALVSTGCATAPKTEPQRQSLVAEADAAVQSMIAKDASLRDFIADAHGYAAFPNIGKAGLIAGGASGRGVVYEDGRPVGYTQLNQGSVGAQIGAQTYSELIVFKDQAALDRVKSGNFEFGADVSAVALKAGAAKTAQFKGGVAVFVQPKGGLMAEASIKGQKLSYEPMDQSEAASSRTPPARPGSTDDSGSSTSGSSTGGSSGGVDVKVESK
jgi:lipid-binding SYLF domain-containing protein